MLSKARDPVLVAGVGDPVSSLAISSTARRRFVDASGNDGVGWMNAFIWFSFAMTFPFP